MATAGCDVSDVLPGPRAPPAAVYRLEDIVGAVADVDAVIAQIEAGFVAASEARVTVAPVVHMGFKPAGDCCIKVKRGHARVACVCGSGCRAATHG